MAENKRDYYEVLGLQKGASADEIKKAYRKVAKECHPDLHPDDAAAAERFKEANEAYEVLSDEDKKARYDQYGFAGVDPSYGAGQAGQGGAGFGGFGGFGGFDMGDIFGDLFGGFGFGGTRQPRNGPRKGENIRVGLSLTFEEAAFGCEKEIRVNAIDLCEACGGTGCQKGTTAETCTECGGTGTVRTRQRVMGMTMESNGPCQRCGGTGKIIKQPCKTCQGAGRVRKPKTVKVNIPAGIDDGRTISLREQGHAGVNGGPRGDLLITIGIKPHPRFEREGASVLMEMDISFVDAALGAELRVPTLDGDVKYRIPEGTQTGTTFRLKGKGIPYLEGNGRGDQYVTVHIETPKGLNAQQKELLRQFGESLGEKTGEKGSPFRKKGKK